MRFYLVTIFLFISFAEILAQKRSGLMNKSELLYNEAKNKAQGGDAKKAKELLFQLLKTNPDFYMAHFALADIYHESAEPDKEKVELMKGLELGGDHYPDGYKFLAELLYGNANYSDALGNAEKYASLKRNLNEGDQKLLETCRFAEQAVKNPVPFAPFNAGEAINSEEDEYWPCLDAEGKELVFTRLKRSDLSGEKIPIPQEDLYVSLRNETGWQKAVPLDNHVNTTENEGAQCISADGRLLFFTSCGRKDSRGSCDIYMSVRKGGRWSEPVNLGPPVNTGAWETQPSVSSDGNNLYFTSNRIGGKGKMDIWKAEKTGLTPQGYPVYGKVANVESINTPGNESSPFIHADSNTLYFASDYWPGMGGNDLFVARYENSRWTVPKNIGYPVNTVSNEEGMIVDIEGKYAWFTSSAKGYGGKDIFSFSLPQEVKPQPVSYVKGKIFDKKTGKVILPDIRLYDLSADAEVQYIHSFENEGEFLLCLNTGRNYGLSVEKEGYLFCSRNFNLEQVFTKSEPYNLSIGLDPLEKGMATVLNNIFFETDSFNLKRQSFPELNKLVDFMKSNPGWIVEIGGHTDNKGGEAYNRELSGKRAGAVVNYLIDQGIARKRLISKGYGFSKPVADNATEEGRTANRRTEFKLIEKSL